MAAFKRSRAQAWPEERGDREHGLYSLHRMFDIVGTHLTHRDVRVLSFLFVDVIDDYERGMIRSGRDFLLALERQGRCDETNFRQVLQLLRIITRHDLLPYVTLKRRRAAPIPAWSEKEPAGGLRSTCCQCGGSPLVPSGLRPVWEVASVLPELVLVRCSESEKPTSKFRHFFTPFSSRMPQTLLFQSPLFPSRSTWLGDPSSWVLDNFVGVWSLHGAARPSPALHCLGPVPFFFFLH
uniref:Death effector domain-containing protein n=1 Tax=Otus sunia TaxID=257818 RepID=A0A8C8AGT4_9STRI